MTFEATCGETNFPPKPKRRSPTRSLNFNPPAWPGERWSPVTVRAGVFGLRYLVSSMGRVFSVRMGVLLRHRLNRYGYRVVGLNEGNRNHTYPVHTLVAEAFIGPRPEGFVVNHKDGNKDNPSVGNLEHVTARQNSIHGCKFVSGRSNVFFGERLTVQEAIAKFGGTGVHRFMVGDRIASGWSPEAAVTTPKGERRHVV